MKAEGKIMSFEGSSRPRSWVLVTAAAILLALGLALAPAAQARESLALDGSYDFAGQFGTGSPGMMAVHEGSDSLYVVDPPNNRILKFDVSDPVAPQPTDFSALGANAITEADGSPLVLAAKSQVAVDNSGGPQDGTIYLATDTATDSRAYAFSATGEWLYTFAHDSDGDFSPTGTPQTGRGIAVSNTGPRAGEIVRFGDSEARTSIYSPAPSPGGFPTVRVGQVPAQFPAGISGVGGAGFTNDGARIQVAVVGLFSTNFSYYDAESLNKLGNYNFGSWGTPFDIGVAPDGTVLARKTASGGDFGRFRQIGSAVTFPPPAVPGTELVERFGFGDPGSGFGIVETTGGYLYSTDTSNGEIDIFGPATAPDADMLETGFVDLTTAELRAEVNPLGLAIYSCEFETGTSTTYGTTVPCDAIPSGNGDVTVTAEVPVTTATTYHSRVVLRADNNTATYSDDLEWIAPDLPEAATLAAGPQQRSGTAILGGTVDANSTPTGYYIEYSTDPGMAGSQRYPAGENVPAGSGANPVRVHQEVPGLANATTYYFRLVAETKAGTDAGGIKSFSTFTDPSVPQPTSCANAEFRTGQSTRLPDCRAWEQVSPQDKNGGQVPNGGIITSPDGNRVTYLASAVFSGAQSLGVNTNYMAERGERAWSSQGIAPPVADTFQTTVYNIIHRAFTPDLSHAAGAAFNVALPGAPGINSGAFRWDVESEENATLAIGGGQSSGRSVYTSFLADDGESGALNAQRIPIDSGPEVPASQQAGYWWTRSGAETLVEAASVLPSGDLAVGGSALIRALSGDGEKLLWSITTSQERPGSEELYVSRRSGQTLWVSEAQGVAQPANSQAEIAAWSRDLRYVYFTSRQQLTTDSTAVPGAGSAGSADLYRFDTESGDLVDLTTQDPAGGGALGVFNVSEDGEDVYFLASGNLVPEASGSGLKVYGLRDGQLRLITDYPAAIPQHGYTFVFTGGQESYGYRRMPRVSSDGRYLLFPFNGDTAGTRMESVYETNGNQVFFRYDWDQDRVDCVSCDPRGRDVTSDSYLTMPEQFRETPAAFAGIGRERHLMSDQGEVIFNTAQSLVAEDVNGKVDSYIWDGDLRLLTNGTSDNNQWAEDASEDFSSVYLLSSEQLVPADIDGGSDLYVARVGGGMAGQQVRPRQIEQECEGDSCQGPGAQIPPLTGQGTQGVQGSSPAVNKCATQRARFRRTARLARSGRAGLQKSRRLTKASIQRYRRQSSAGNRRQAVKSKRLMRRNKARTKRAVVMHRRSKAALTRCLGGGS